MVNTGQFWRSGLAGVQCKIQIKIPEYYLATASLNMALYLTTDRINQVYININLIMTVNRWPLGNHDDICGGLSDIQPMQCNVGQSSVR